MHPVTPVEIQGLETGVAEERRRALRCRCAVLGLDIAEEVAVVHRKRLDPKHASNPARKMQNLERHEFHKERQNYEQIKNIDDQVRQHKDSNREAQVADAVEGVHCDGRRHQSDDDYV